MAITRTQYITIAELNEILGVSTYTNADLIKVYEASELMKYTMFRNEYETEYNTSSAPNDLKLATAYQVQYMEDNDDNSYNSTGESMSLGKFSINESNNTEDNSEFRKISPKSRRYLIDSGLIRRIL